MPSLNLPIVSASIDVGEAAKRASRANVSAVVVRASASAALKLVRLNDLPDDAEGPLDAFVPSIGKAIARTEAVAADPNGFGLIADHGEIGEFDVGALHMQQLNAAIGYKVCSNDSSHQYPASFPKRNCPHADGVLKLEFF